MEAHRAAFNELHQANQFSLNSMCLSRPVRDRRAGGRFYGRRYRLHQAERLVPAGQQEPAEAHS